MGLIIALIVIYLLMLVILTMLMKKQIVKRSIIPFLLSVISMIVFIITPLDFRLGFYVSYLIYFIYVLIFVIAGSLKRNRAGR